MGLKELASGQSNFASRDYIAPIQGYKKEVKY